MNRNKAETLKNSCDKVEEFNYFKPFQPEEISEFETKLSKIAIKIDVIEVELKEIKDEFKEKLNPLKDEFKELLTWIRDKGRSVKEECYINYEGEYAVFYNADGEQIYKRPLEASERQKTIFMETRSAVNE